MPIRLKSYQERNRRRMAKAEKGSAKKIAVYPPQVEAYPTPTKPYVHTRAEVMAFRQAAAKDGWTSKRTYPNEAMFDASEHTYDRFVMYVVCRSEADHSITIFGPDHLRIEPPRSYSMGEIVKRVRFCPSCRRKNVATFDAGHKERACTKCMSKLKGGRSA